MFPNHVKGKEKLEESEKPGNKKLGVTDIKFVCSKVIDFCVNWLLSINAL